MSHQHLLFQHLLLLLKGLMGEETEAIGLFQCHLGHVILAQPHQLGRHWCQEGVIDTAR